MFACWTACALTCTFTFNVAAQPASEALADARKAVVVALDAQAHKSRDAALRVAAVQYHAALADPALPPHDAHHARRALRAIATLLEREAPNAVSTSAPPDAIPAALPAQHVAERSPPVQREPILPLSPALEPADATYPDIATPSKPDRLILNAAADATPTDTVADPATLDDRRTFAIAYALLQASPADAPALRDALRRGANRHGRFGPGLNPPPAGGDALHTLVAVAALTTHQPLAPDHARTLAAVLLLEQSPAGGWRDPLTPVDRPGDYPLPTAANLLTLRWLAESLGPSDPTRGDLVEAQSRGRARLQTLLAARLPDDPNRPRTFSDAFLDHAQAALDLVDPTTASRLFRNALRTQLARFLQRPVRD